MKFIKNEYIDMALRTLDADERQKVLSWFDHLANWENDEHVRKMAKAMPYQNTFFIDTPDDMRIFFTLDNTAREIVVLDLAKPSRFEAVGAASE